MKANHNFRGSSIGMMGDVKELSYFTPLLVFLKMKEPFVGVERRKSAAASPTKRIEPNPGFELELTMRCTEFPQFLIQLHYNARSAELFRQRRDHQNQQGTIQLILAVGEDVKYSNFMKLFQ